MNENSHWHASFLMSSSCRSDIIELTGNERFGNGRNTFYRNFRNSVYTRISFEKRRHEETEIMDETRSDCLKIADVHHACYKSERVMNPVGLYRFTEKESYC